MIKKIFRKLKNINIASLIYFNRRSKMFAKKYNDNNRMNYNRVFMFHSISNMATDTSKYNSNVKGFECFIKKMVNEYECVTISNILESSQGKFAITFDDTFENVYLNAYPVLKKYNVPFTIFVSTDLLNKKDYLKVDELLELDKEPLCTIGAHTKSHPLLRKCKDSQREIAESKTILEKIINKEVHYFAYPYGSAYACSKRNVSEAQNAGYDLAFSAISGVLNAFAKKNPFFLPRINGDHLVLELEKEGK